MCGYVSFLSFLCSGLILFIIPTANKAYCLHFFTTKHTKMKRQTYFQPDIFHSLQATSAYICFYVNICPSVLCRRATICFFMIFSFNLTLAIIQCFDCFCDFFVASALRKPYMPRHRLKRGTKNKRNAYLIIFLVCSFGVDT